LAALHLLRRGQDPLLLVLAADHVIQDRDAFHQSIAKAVVSAEEGALVTFGVMPTHAETGYGYIRTGPDTGGSALSVESFVEKPDLVTAQSYIDSGDYYWNSGIFLFRASRYIEELTIFQPDVVSACEAALRSEHPDLDFIRLSDKDFETSPNISIDYAVMERTNRAVMVPLNSGWSDVGSWSAIWDLGLKDATGNVLKGDVFLSNVTNSYISSSGRLIGAVGIDNLVLVETPDAVLVASKDHVQDVKEIVDQLKHAGRAEATDQVTVYRPWGNYQSIDHGERFQVKHIRVKPGEQLSLQKHHHRAEHWVVVNGTARVTRGDKTYLVSENQSTYIPIGEVHRLENPGKIPLDLIEVQTGSYLGEDDIIRLDDVYGR
jgi:mannose-1-phosphate guanylyltransferase